MVKESFPPSLIEFGPKGSKAEGFKEEYLISLEKPYPLSGDKIPLEPLHVWELPKKYASCDLSELVYSKKTGLSLLSQKCQIILELLDLDLQETVLGIQDFYQLPRRLQKAEAFVLLPGKGEFLVFEDKKNIIENNFYFLSPKS